MSDIGYIIIFILLFTPLPFYLLIHITKHLKVKCKDCKTPLSDYTERQLFLLPVYTDHTYKASADFFIHHLTPIHDLSQIPTGRRACYLDYYTCSRCGKRIVIITDFLYVRGTENIVDCYTYDFNLFENFKAGLVS